MNASSSSLASYNDTPLPLAQPLPPPSPPGSSPSSGRGRGWRPPCYAQGGETLRCMLTNEVLPPSFLLYSQEETNASKNTPQWSTSKSKLQSKGWMSKVSFKLTSKATTKVMTGNKNYFEKLSKHNLPNDQSVIDELPQLLLRGYIKVNIGQSESCSLLWMNNKVCPWAHRDLSGLWCNGCLFNRVARRSEAQSFVN